MAAGEVHDAQTPVRERGHVVGVQPGAVRPAVNQDVAHQDRARRLVIMQAVGRHDAGDPAHSGDPHEDGVLGGFCGRVAVDEFPEPELEHQQ